MLHLGLELKLPYSKPNDSYWSECIRATCSNLSMLMAVMQLRHVWVIMGQWQMPMHVCM